MDVNNATLQDVQAAIDMQDRSDVCSRLSLKRAGESEIELAPAKHQYKLHTPFGEWSVTGPSRIKRYLKLRCGNIEKRPMTPVRCSCGYEAEVMSTKLKQKLSQGCKRCRANKAQRAVDKADWQAKSEATD